MLNSRFYQPVHNASTFSQKTQTHTTVYYTNRKLFLWGAEYIISPSSLRVSYDGRNLFALRQEVIKFIECRVIALVNKIS